jgi:uncharacterized protein (TIGR03546 family)
MIQIIAKLIVALNGNVKASQIAAGFSWGLLLALVPAGNLLWLALFLISFVLKHHHVTKLFIMLVVKLLLPVLAMRIDAVGWWVLNLEVLRPYFIILSNTPFVPFTKFNNTLVMGGFCLGVGLFIPSYILMRLFVPLYRNTLAPKIRDNKIVKALKNIPIISSIGNLIGKAIDAEKAFK